MSDLHIWPTHSPTQGGDNVKNMETKLASYSHSLIQHGLKLLARNAQVISS